jgi:prenyltransferase beta subunit
LCQRSIEGDSLATPGGSQYESYSDFPFSWRFSAVKRAFLAVSTFVCFVFPLYAQSDAQKKQTIAYLQKLQSEDGGFRPDARAKASDAVSTTTAFRALKYFGGTPSDRKGCAEFVQKCFDKDGGGFSMRPGGKVEYRATAVGIMGVVDMKIPLAPYVDAVVKYLDEHSKNFEEIRLTAASFESLGKRPPHAEAWLATIARLRNDDGSYGKGEGRARDTGGAACAVLRLGGKLEHRETVLKTLNDGQREDGGFGKTGEKESDLETCYRIVRAFHMLKAKPRGADKLRAFIARCRNDDGGYGVAPGKPSSVGGCYFAGIILHWLDEE